MVPTFIKMNHGKSTLMAWKVSFVVIIAQIKK